MRKYSYEYTELPIEYIDEIDISFPYHLIPLILVRFIPKSKPLPLAHVVVIKNNLCVEWKVQMIIPTALKAFLDKNPDEFLEIKFSDSYTYVFDKLTTRLEQSVPFDSNFMKCEFVYERPVQCHMTTLLVTIGFKDQEFNHLLFKMVVFRYDFPYFYGPAKLPFYYEGIKSKMKSNKLDERFIYDWNGFLILKERDLDNIRGYEYLPLDDLTCLAKDPWFCLFSLLEENEIEEWLQLLNELNSTILWKKLQQASIQFSKRQMERK